ncbi:hypothetical protein MOQ_006396 [Trypanosoma cruzi marinkellei]|uniref:Uncharacterized protein n=1 Tax=Trypanosoma cruzi marinkellei TaxID=85056 RepID=K2N538_TRYCR|nr:hypothetical protein MOQ_006396 [Trypanosoma cruzi marinkellei]
MKTSRVICGRLRRRTYGGMPLMQKQQCAWEREETLDTFPLSNAERTTSALACQLLERHRRRNAAELHWRAAVSSGGTAEVGSHQTQKEIQEESLNNSQTRPPHMPTVDAFTGYGKAAVTTNLAHMADSRVVDTRHLLEATDREWEALTAGSKMSATLTETDDRPTTRAWVRYSRGNASAHLPGKFGEKIITPFDAVMRRYNSVVINHRFHVVTVDAFCSWRVNMPANDALPISMRCVLARKEQLDRQSEWRKLRKSQLPLGSDIGSGNFEKEGRHVENLSSSRAFSSMPFASPVFRRYCLQFGSHTLRRVAFLTDPTLYFVLCNWRSTGNESLMEVRQQAESLSHRYMSMAHLS